MDSSKIIPIRYHDAAAGLGFSVFMRWSAWSISRDPRFTLVSVTANVDFDDGGIGMYNAEREFDKAHELGGRSVFDDLLTMQALFIRQIVAAAATRSRQGTTAA